MATGPDVLVVNAGSATLKLALVAPDDELRGARELAAPGGRADLAEVRAAVDELLAEAGLDRRADGGARVAVGHRVVHGGRDFAAPVRIDAAVAARLAELTALAPLHQPAALAALDEVREVLPGAVQVACFDTAFHATLPPAAATYAVPASWRERYGVRRYGFHGLSHAYASRRAAELTGARRVVTCHLGSGASLAAVLDGASVDTTMGFTPLEGLVMSTRSGDVDPGLLLWLQTSAGLGAGELQDALFHASGLLALAGTADMRAVVDRAAGRDEAAVLALDVYLRRLRAGIAAMTASLGGLDALVFTGGVGERSPQIRAAAADGLAFLGVGIDPARNAGHAASAGDTDLTGEGASTRVLVVAAREDLEIARGVRSVLAAG
ncbi:acetate/propionate family kinase [Frankia sp. CNm7]|uniref:Acetate kinase n=1 Tax=Frankia nepalensis TaxID=1836974 RepID=A0A937RE70_9ACTN|nr:acetate/propionate family kinase [Frankia nepalensis]MBL7501314.1 acetate/propionate family kinase [Frankia nepalensis]MBL7510836.1 acetate/propionate family kinase [Frankia nepalensis]MBL7521580.1 acetate/propionate family kinase [Frankia nepalensis]MBL7628612.1 acetate/propionate family kinase [Frankia nepalensis]